MVSPEHRGQAGVEFVTKSGRKLTSEELVFMVIFITDGVGEGSLGILTIFCQSDSDKSGAISQFFDFIPVGLTKARHSGGEDIH